MVVGLGLGSMLFGQEGPDPNNPQPLPPPRPPESGWRKFPGGRPGPGAPAGPEQGPQGQQGPMPQAQMQMQSAPLPEQLVVPAGTWITIRVNQPLSSDHNDVGDAFSGTLAQPLIANGVVVARRGQMVAGRVSEAMKAGRVKGTSRLGIELTEIGLADGQQVQISTQLMERRGDTSNGRDVAAVGATAGIGAAIGGGAAGGFGAGMGAIAGAGAGLIGVLATRGRATEIYPESVVTFRTLAPITVSTVRAPQAFQAPQNEDYDHPRMEGRMNGPQPGHYPPPYRPYVYPYSGYFWGPSVGVYVGPGRYGRGYRRW